MDERRSTAAGVDEPTLTVARLHRTLEHAPDAELTLPQYRVLGLLAGGVIASLLRERRTAGEEPPPLVTIEEG